MRNRLQNIVLHVADLGYVAYIALAVFSLIVIVGEFVRPGIAVNYLSPQRLLAVGILAGALSVLVPEKKRSAFSRVGYWCVAIAMTVLVYFGTQQYFSGLPDEALRLALLSGVTVFSAFLLFDLSPST